MGMVSGLYISEKEQLTNIHICLNVRQNVCALDEQKRDLMPSMHFIFELRCRTSLPNRAITMPLREILLYRQSKSIVLASSRR